MAEKGDEEMDPIGMIIVGAIIIVRIGWRFVRPAK